jgi:hypothetical protein
VLGSQDRNTNIKNRSIVNSLGEGAIRVCNANGNIENADYIQSSGFTIPRTNWKMIIL